jgi:hypothetical protein
MAEAIMNWKGRPNFAAFSAGSHPKGSVHPAALQQLERAHLPGRRLPKQELGRVFRAGRAEARFCIHRVRQRCR